MIPIIHIFKFLIFGFLVKLKTVVSYIEAIEVESEEEVLQVRLVASLHQLPHDCKGENGMPGMYPACSLH